jgi:hypothetical protein
VTIFDYIKDIIVTKRGNLPLGEYVPFLVNRWLSFINPTVCECINLNINSKVFLEDKELHYKMMISLFPKMKYSPRIAYVKKLKEDKKELDSKVKYLSESLQISQREALLLMSCSN